MSKFEVGDIVKHEDKDVGVVVGDNGVCFFDTVDRDREWRTMTFVPGDMERWRVINGTAEAEAFKAQYALYRLGGDSP